jgi:lipoyl(octanoyl) transferase
LQPATTNKTITFQDLGLIPYNEAWEYQDNLFQQVIARKVANRDLPEEEQQFTGNYFLFCEHPPVFTLGKSGDEEHLLLNNEGLAKQGIQYYKVNRGGDITHHGPGQVVGYPILDLDYFFTDIHKYLRLLEETIILALADYGIAAGRLPGATGVWLDADVPGRARKICAMGIRCSRWVTMHGFALNVNNNLDYFNHIIPCGISDKGVTSIQQELGHPVDMDEVKNRIKGHFLSLFDGVEGL